MKILSPAKINLILRILDRRTDGYHLLQTYFQLLNWGDEMEFILQKTPSIDIIGKFGDLATTDNLIYKAAKLLEPYKTIEQGVHILIQKNIPHGSGLGGGSSNAGTTLTTLNKLWGCNLPQKKLQTLGLTLGADVPIFVLNKSAWATGIGENLQSASIQSRFYVLIFPPCQISTVEIFSHPDLIRNQSPVDLSLINDSKAWTNTCTPIVLANYPAVNKAFNKASQHAKIHMSGTGSTLFSVFNSKEEANGFMAKLPENWCTKLCQSKKSEKK